MTTASIILLVIAGIVVIGLAISGIREARSRRLRTHFGSEYDRALQEYGSRSKAEQVLLARQRRVEKIHIRPLTPEERDRLTEQWHRIQVSFVDEPAGSIREADQLVFDAMQARGYPMGDFERRAEDISVHHPQVVRNYRAAHDIAMRQQKGQASTEDLRQALVYYRDLFDDLIEAHAVGAREGKQ